jgi:hypothetical protein
LDGVAKVSAVVTVPTLTEVICKADTNMGRSHSDGLLPLSPISAYRERHRERHRLSQRKYYQRRCAAKKAAAAKADAKPPDPAAQIALAPISDEDRAKALRRLQQVLGPEGLDECVCVSCDRLVRRAESVRKDASDWRYMARMRLSFGEVDAALPMKLINEYTAPACVTFLAGVLVSPRSFHCFTDRNGHLTTRFTVQCINRKELSTKVLHFERVLYRCTPRSVFARIDFVRAICDATGEHCCHDACGRHRCIRSHSIVFDCTPGPPLSLLPRSISEVSTFRVSMVGDFTEEQTRKVKKMHEIRVQRVRDVFDFYRLNNCLYASVTPNDAVLNEMIDSERIAQLQVDYIEDE